MRIGTGWVLDVRAGEARRAVEERRGRMRRVRVGVLALPEVGSVDAVAEIVSAGGNVDEEAMVNGFRRNFSHGLVGVVGGRAR